GGAARDEHSGAQPGRADAEDLVGAAGDLAPGESAQVAVEAYGGGGAVEVVVGAERAAARPGQQRRRPHAAGQAGRQRRRGARRGDERGPFEQRDGLAAVVLARAAAPGVGALGTGERGVRGAGRDGADRGARQGVQQATCHVSSLLRWWSGWGPAWAAPAGTPRPRSRCRTGPRPRSLALAERRRSRPGLQAYRRCRRWRPVWRSRRRRAGR